MPVSTSAKKALRKDRRRTVVNNVVRSKMRTAIKRFREEKSQDAMSEMYSSLDRAVKRNIIHRKKAARVKSRLSKLLDVSQAVDASSVPSSAKKTSTAKQSLASKKPAAKKAPASKKTVPAKK